MPRAADELLDLLSHHLGSGRSPSAVAPPARATHDLSRADLLVGLDDDDVAARLEARLSADPRDPAAALRAELKAFAAHPSFAGPGSACALTHDFGAALRAGVDAARAATGRPRVVVAAGVRAAVLPGADAPPPPYGDLDETLRAIDAAGPALACVVLEPRGDGDALREVARRARDAGAWVLVDESRTAGRLAPGSVAADLNLDADVLLLGPSVAAGLPFAALLSRGAEPDLPPVDPVVAEVASAITARLRATPVCDALAAFGEQLRARITARARNEDVHVEFVGPGALPHLRFAGQENAEAPLIAHHFQLELHALGVSAEADLAIPCGVDDVDSDAICDAFEGAISRIRTLLIEHNSYLSGGIPFVFPGNDPRLRDRGIARYRHPKLAAVDIEPTADAGAMRIAFAPGPLGPITSSGFYLPTRLRGDFDLRIRYDVRAWEPGPDSACLGLFVQNEPSTARYYAQIMSTSNRPGEVFAAAGLTGELVGRSAVPGRGGWLRLQRTGDRLTASHRDEAEADFAELGTQQPCSVDDVITGAKIWSKVRCGGLVVDLSSMTVDAEIPEDQIPRLEPRPDPRRA